MNMVRWKFKSCPRCGGDMYLEVDTEGWFWDCVLCGFRAEIDSAESKERTGHKR